MDQSSLPSNSLMNQKEKEEPSIEKLEVVPVVSGKVVRKKKSLGRKFVDTFISEDITDIPNYLKTQVLVPLIKKAVLDTMSILLNGKTRGGYSNSNEVRRYDRMGIGGSGNVYLMGSSPVTQNKNSSIEKRTFNDLYYEDGGEGERVRENIEGIFNTYQKVRVADVLELSGMSDLIEFPDNNYGWTNLSGMQLIHDGKGGSTLKMPPARPLD